MKKGVLVLLTVMLICLVFWSCSKDTHMVLVLGDTFQMGSLDGNIDEKPVHEVVVSDFYICKYEVTIQDWYDFIVDFEKKDFKKAKSLTNENVNYDNSGNLQIVLSKKTDDVQCAMYSVSWYDAIEYCNWLSEFEGFEKCYTITQEKVECNFKAKGYRLPTEAEWEYVARGGAKSKGYEYSGNANYFKVAWISENSENKIQRVGTKEPNELGIYDMSGNLFEWCWDLYSSDYYTTCNNLGIVTNPIGSTMGTDRVLRGGSWFHKTSFSRVTTRGRGVMYFGDSGQGFRIARTP